MNKNVRLNKISPWLALIVSFCLSTACAFFEPPRVGEKLDRYLARVIGALPDPCIVTIGDRQVPRSWWRNVAVKPGVVIGLAAGVAGGDGNGNSNVGRVVMTILVAAAAYYAGGAAAGAAGYVAGPGVTMTFGQTLAYVAASAAVMTVGMMAVNALLPLPTNDLSGAGGSAASPTYSLAGGSNRVRRYRAAAAGDRNPPDVSRSGVRRLHAVRQRQ